MVCKVAKTSSILHKNRFLPLLKITAMFLQDFKFGLFFKNYGKILKTQLCNYLVDFNILQFQLGFRSKYSTKTALLKVTFK